MLKTTFYSTFIIITANFQKWQHSLGICAHKAVMYIYSKEWTGVIPLSAMTFEHLGLGEGTD